MMIVCVLLCVGVCMCNICVEVSCLKMPLTIYAVVCTTSKDATLTLTPTEFTVDEGPNPDSAELCVVISNLPAQGLQCDLVATLTPMGGTAGKYCNQQGKVLYVVGE